MAKFFHRKASVKAGGARNLFRAPAPTPSSTEALLSRSGRTCAAGRHEPQVVFSACELPVFARLHLTTEIARHFRQSGAQCEIAGFRVEIRSGHFDYCQDTEGGIGLALTFERDPCSDDGCELLKFVDVSLDQALPKRAGIKAAVEQADFGLVSVV